MKLFGSILFPAILSWTGHSASMRRLSNPSSVLVGTDGSNAIGQSRGDQVWRGLFSFLQQPLSGGAPKNQQGERVDRYAPEPSGHKTLGGWCDQPVVHDPACDVNAAAVPLEEEIDLVLKHITCQLRPQTAGCQGLKTEDEPEEPQETKKVESVSLQELQKRFSKKVGDSDKSFQAADSNHDGAVSSDEFVKLCAKVGCSSDDAAKLFKQLGGSDGALSEKSFKDGLGATADEIASRLQSKFRSASKGFADADSDGDGEISHQEMRKHCKQVASDDACLDVQARFGERAITEEEYRSFIGTTLDDLATLVEKTYGDAISGFTAADGDGDGKISAKEFQSQCRSLGVAAASCERLQNIVDADSSSSSSQTEYTNAMGVPVVEWKRRLENKYGGVLKGFAEADIDGDGVVSSFEFEAQAQKQLGIPEAAAKALAEHADSDGDGLISKEEYLNNAGATIKEWERRANEKFADAAAGFAAADKDGNGHISEDEFIAQCAVLGIPTGQAKELYRQNADVDGDGAVNEKEYGAIFSGKAAAGVAADPSVKAWRKRTLEKYRSAGEAFAAAGGSEESGLTAEQFGAQCDTVAKLTSPSGCRIAFATIDANGDGVVSAREYQNALGVTLNVFRRRVFQEFGGSDKAWFSASASAGGTSGGLTKEAFLKHCANLHVPQADAERLFNEIDVGSPKGTISKEEYENVIGVTAQEMRQRVRKEFGSPREAIKTVQHGEEDQQVDMVEWDAICKACDIPKASCDALAHEAGFSDTTSGSITLEQYDDFMEVTLQGLKERLLEKYGDSEKAFVAADGDGDGVVSRDELLAQCEGVQVRSENCKQLATQVDENADGIVTEEEYLNFLGVSVSEFRRRLHNHFTASDVGFRQVSGGDGCVSKEEFLGMCSSDLGIPMPRAAKLFEEASTDNDGCLSKAEWRKLVDPSGGAEEGVQDAIARSESLEDRIKRLIALRQHLVDDGRMDPELGRSLDNMIRDSQALLAKEREISRLVASGDMHDANEALEELLVKAEDVEGAMFDLETGVHPHGHKWWRYRWEYSFVEALMVVALLIVMLVLNKCIDYGEVAARTFRPHKQVGFSSLYNLYHSIYLRGSTEFLVLGGNQFLIWALNELGFFNLIVAQFPSDDTGMAGVPVVPPHVMSNDGGTFVHLMRFAVAHAPAALHLPTTGEDLVYTLRSVNMHLFLGLAFYYVIMFHIVFASISILEVFMKHTKPEAFRAYMKHKLAGNREGWLQGTPREVNSTMQRVSTMGRFQTDDRTMGFIAGCMDKPGDFENMQAYTVAHLMRREDVVNAMLEELGDKPNRAAYVKKAPELKEALLQLPLYRYMAVSLNRSIEQSLRLSTRFWLLMIFVFIINAFLHVNLHVAFIEMLPFFVALIVAFVVFKTVALRRHFGFTVKPENQAYEALSEKEHKGMGFHQRNNTEVYFNTLQQVIYFLLCFSGARIMTSYFFWTDYFYLTASMLAVLLILYISHIFIGSIVTPLFLMSYSTPPYMDHANITALMDVLKEFLSLQRMEKGGEPYGDPERTWTPRSNLGSTLDLPF